MYSIKRKKMRVTNISSSTVSDCMRIRRKERLFDKRIENENDDDDDDTKSVCKTLFALFSSFVEDNNKCSQYI